MSWNKAERGSRDGVPGLCPLRALPWSLAVCQGRSLTLRPKLLDERLGLFLRKMRDVLPSALCAVPWERLSAKNYLLDYDPIGPEHKPAWPPEPGHQGADPHSSYTNRVSRCKIRLPDVCIALLQELLVLGVRKRESANMLPSGQVKEKKKKRE